VTKRGTYLGGHTLAPRSWFGRSSRKPENFNTKAEREAIAKINKEKFGWGKQREKSAVEMAEEKRQFELTVEKFRASLPAPLVEKNPAEIAEERKARRHCRPRWFQKYKD
jgi:hypothetical protein